MALVPPVQFKSIDAGLGVNITLTFASNNAAGNTMIVCHSVAGASPGDRVTDSRNTYGADAEDIAGAGTPDVTGGISSAPNCGAGANTVAVSGAGSKSGRNLHIFEYAGLIAVAPLDKVANGANFGAALSSGSTATLSQASELVIGFGFAGNATAGPFTPGSGLTARTDVAGGVIDSAVGDKEVAATTPVDASFTATGGSSNWGCLVATYKALPPAPIRVGTPAYTASPSRRRLM